MVLIKHILQVFGLEIQRKYWRVANQLWALKLTPSIHNTFYAKEWRMLINLVNHLLEGIYENLCFFFLFQNFINYRQLRRGLVYLSTGFHKFVLKTQCFKVSYCLFKSLWPHTKNFMLIGFFFYVCFNFSGRNGILVLPHDSEIWNAGQ